MSGFQPPQRTAGERLIKQLTVTMSDYEATADFSCSGSIGISRFLGDTRYGDFTSTTKPITSAPITIRWDAPSRDVSRKITFPVRSDKEELLQQLVKDCEPATFGFKGKDVLNEAIRKADKLEASEFSTSFNPYDFGIVDAIAQALLPSIVRPMSKGRGIGSDAKRWGVVAELYKLNVYSGPSGMFKPHVDTPRGFTQFGSLVVCLPNPHDGKISMLVRKFDTDMRTGSQLRVAHKGVERLFDLRSSPKYLGGSWYLEDRVFCDSSIQWAAFYSDCEHEVLPVTSGHRVTLTYQLYVLEHLGGLGHPQFPPADPKLYPLYNSIKEMLFFSAFMKNGGILGFHCAHQYPDSEVGTDNFPCLPHALKGIDAVLFTIFRALGLIVHIWPIPEGQFSKEDADAAPRPQDLLIIEEESEGELKASEPSVY